MNIDRRRFKKLPQGYSVRWAESWFVRDLKLISSEFDVLWNNKTHRWVIFQNGDPNRIVENQQTKAYRPLDQRILRKTRVDTFLTINPKAQKAYMEDDRYAMYAFTARGLQGLSDYLTEGR